MGNIVPRAGIEPTSQAFRASVLASTPPRPPAVTMQSRYLCMTCLRGLCRPIYIYTDIAWLFRLLALNGVKREESGWLIDRDNGADLWS